MAVLSRLMVNLTQPAKLCFQNQIPEDKTTRNYYLQIESHLQLYKEVGELITNEFLVYGDNDTYFKNRFHIRL